MLLTISFPKQEIAGIEHIPEKRASIYVLCTHPTAFDGQVLTSVVRKKSRLPMLGQTHFDNFVEIGLGYVLRRSPNTFPIYRTKASLPPKRQKTYFGEMGIFSQIPSHMLKEAEGLNRLVISGMIDSLNGNRINYLLSIGRVSNKDMGTFFNPVAMEILQKTQDVVPVVPVTFSCSKPKKVPFNASMRMTLHNPMHERQNIKKSLVPYLNHS
jgi:hypothetical protein